MKRDTRVTHDLDRDIRNNRTKQVLSENGVTKVHVLTVGTYDPTLVLFENGRDALQGTEAMRACGWDITPVGNSDRTAPPAYWVRHPSPFAAPHNILTEGRVFPPGSPCPTDVEYARHQNGIVFRRVRYSHPEQPGWRAMSEYGGDGGEFSWSLLNSDVGDSSPMTEVFLPADSQASVEDLRHPVWRPVEAVATRERLSRATANQTLVVELVYDAVVAALKAAGKG